MQPERSPLITGLIFILKPVVFVGAALLFVLSLPITLWQKMVDEVTLWVPPWAIFAVLLGALVLVGIIWGGSTEGPSR